MSFLKSVLIVSESALKKIHSLLSLETSTFSGNNISKNLSKDLHHKNKIHYANIWFAQGPSCELRSGPKAFHTSINPSIRVPRTYNVCLADFRSKADKHICGRKMFFWVSYHVISDLFAVCREHVFWLVIIFCRHGRLSSGL